MRPALNGLQGKAPSIFPHIEMIFVDSLKGPANNGGSSTYLLPESNTYFLLFEIQFSTVDFFLSALLYKKSEFTPEIAQRQQLHGLRMLNTQRELPFRRQWFPPWLAFGHGQVANSI